MAPYIVSDVKAASLLSDFSGQEGLGGEKWNTSGFLSIEVVQQQQRACSYRLHLPAWHLKAGSVAKVRARASHRVTSILPSCLGNLETAFLFCETLTKAPGPRALPREEPGAVSRARHSFEADRAFS